MFVELCLVVRIVLNEGDHILLRNVSIRPCAATREPQKTTVETRKEDPIVGTQDTNANLKSLWIYKPVAHEVQATGRGNGAGGADGIYDPRPVVLRAPHLLTKLAKTFAYGLEPYFSKGYFEPFERRPKPVTLVGFRRNGLIPRKTVKSSAQKSSEVAELQSKFNDISNFWLDGATGNLD